MLLNGKNVTLTSLPNPQTRSYPGSQKMEIVKGYPNFWRCGKDDVAKRIADEENAYSSPSSCSVAK